MASFRSTPSGGMMFTAPAVWHNNGTTSMFAADGGGTAAWTLEGGRLVEKWHNGTGGTSPVVAGGLLYVYDPGGSLHIYEPAKGTLLTSLGAGPGHWQALVMRQASSLQPSPCSVKP